MSKTLYYLLLLCLLWAGTPVFARTVEAEGAAPIGASVAQAKRLALQDAIRQALMQGAAQVSTTTVTTANGVVADNMRFSARGRVTGVSVLREWTDESHYYVRIRANVPGATSLDGVRPTTARAAGSNGDGVAPAVRLANGDQDALSHYRRKVAVSQFHVLDRTQVADLPGIEVALAQELERRLSLDDRLLALDASQYLLPLSGADVLSQRRILGALPPARDAQQVAAEFAESLGVQFVVSGAIRDLGVSNRFLGQQLRNIELDIFVYDGISGAEVARHRVNETAEKSGYGELMPRDAGLMTEKFFASPFGRQVDKTLDKLVDLIVADVTTQPFTARVIRSEGRQVYFDAGGRANLRVGDVLNAYKVTDAPVADLAGQHALGYAETPATQLIVTQVQRQFSVGELASETTRLAPGDVIRFEP